MREADEAIRLDPGVAFCHYVRGACSSRQDRLKEAEAVGQRSDPAGPGRCRLSGAAGEHRDWAGGDGTAALDAADRGLALDPEHAQCTNLRAMALVQLGRKDEAERHARLGAGQRPGKRPHARQPGLGPVCIDTSEHATYTEEEPNALEPDKVSEFLACMREVYPQHYAMTFLGFATGLRPSSLRPLRRKGPAPDVRWDEGVILVRRSHSLGDEVMDTTKTKLRQRISVPLDVIEVLADHVKTQLTTPEQIGSDLLFPAADGGYLGEHCLRKPFAKVGALIGLEMSFTPRGLRRTFNDLARTARVEALVTKSISGHLTDRMREHYSTVHPVEQRESIGAVLRLVKGGAVTGEHPASGTRGGTQTTVSGTFRGQSE